MAGKVAYHGRVEFASGEWVGVLLSEPAGRNDGCVNGKRCVHVVLTLMPFMRISRVLPSGTSEPNLIMAYSCARDPNDCVLCLLLSNPASRLCVLTPTRAVSIAKAAVKQQLLMVEYVDRRDR